MAKIPRAERIELFLQEVESYLPEIRQGLAILTVERSATAIVDELHRLFHNIKEAASQVQLTDLSRGAKIVETLLAELAEDGRPVSDRLLTVLEQTVGLLGEFIWKVSPLPEDEVNLYARIALLFAEFSRGGNETLLAESDGRGRRGPDEQQEYRSAVRSILPLLMELAGYLSSDAHNGRDNNAKVYGKLSRAVLTLVTAARVAGIEQRYQLLEELYLLLEALRSGVLNGQPEMPGLIIDFLQFLEAIYTYAEPDNSSTMRRVKEMLRSIHRHLPMSGREEPTGIHEIPELPGEETINGHPALPAAAVEGWRVVAEEPAATVDEVGDEQGRVDDVALAGKSLPEQEVSATLPGESRLLRGRPEDLDELQGIEDDLVVARGALAKTVEKFTDTLQELDWIKESLRWKSQELAAGFEVRSFNGFNPRPGDESSGSELTAFDLIELDRCSQLDQIIESFNEISVDFDAMYATLTSLTGEIAGQIGKQQLTMRLMQDKLMRIRMTPMSSLSRVLFRTVQETARKQNKKVHLVITGEDVYLDRFVWVRITDPLIHILRNAVDHGVETPAKRVAAGKPEIGTIHVEADQRSRSVILRISDDGSGIDGDRVREKIRSGGLADNPDALNEKELLEYLFHPTFTTRQDISAIAGRGTGLDVVRRNIQDLGGTVQIHNNPGQGVTFELHIPLTLSVNRAVIVAVAGRSFAVPLQHVQQIKRFSLEEVEVRDGLFLRVGDARIPVVNLGFYLELEQLSGELPSGGEGVLAILFQQGDKQFAVSVQEIVEQREIIVKSLGRHLTHVHGISGATLTGLGELIPILNLRELVVKKMPLSGS